MGNPAVETELKPYPPVGQTIEIPELPCNSPAHCANPNDNGHLGSSLPTRPLQRSLRHDPAIPLNHLVAMSNSSSPTYRHLFNIYSKI
jgi:hypothetical protein